MQSEITYSVNCETVKFSGCVYKKEGDIKYIVTDNVNAYSGLLQSSFFGCDNMFLDRI